MASEQCCSQSKALQRCRSRRDKSPWLGLESCSQPLFLVLRVTFKISPVFFTPSCFKTGIDGKEALRKGFHELGIQGMLHVTLSHSAEAHSCRSSGCYLQPPGVQAQHPLPEPLKCLMDEFTQEFSLENCHLGLCSLTAGEEGWLWE